MKMKIKFIYRHSLDFFEQEKDFLLKESNNFGLVEIEKYSSRLGALDIVSIIETSLTFFILNSIKGFSAGFFGEDWFKNLGEKVRKELVAEIIQVRGFIRAYFDVFIKNKTNKQEAFLISVNIEDVTLYVVINHFNMTDQLLDKLPKALIDTYRKICLKQIIIESKICQLFPDFKKNEWRYLFTPTYVGFGNYVDNYYDFKLHKQIRINSEQVFSERFAVIDEDKYKFIINALIDR